MPTSLGASVGGPGAAPACQGVCSPSIMTRLEESNSKLLEAERRLQGERHHTVVLEQHLEKMRLEPGKASASQKAAPKNKPGRDQGRVLMWGVGAASLLREEAVNSALWPSSGSVGSGVCMRAELCLPLLLCSLSQLPARSRSPSDPRAHLDLAQPRVSP
ncbi:Hypothetical predicted protein [Marmota monax]|uniref:Uncharacterized protein n=1 Tax=Marmota monax TaxID=9995 RepID=A0A5E4B8T9_MARMO|nr:hypothetical protein GHT09_012246 [Marmota monax]VTJ65696.1 Hypothetical predicted protein [Marmota monax]